MKDLSPQEICDKVWDKINTNTRGLNKDRIGHEEFFQFLKCIYKQAKVKFALLFNEQDRLYAWKLFADCSGVTADGGSKLITKEEFINDALPLMKEQLLAGKLGKHGFVPKDGPPKETMAEVYKLVKPRGKEYSKLLEVELPEATVLAEKGLSFNI